MKNSSKGNKFFVDKSVKRSFFGYCWTAIVLGIFFIAFLQLGFLLSTKPKKVSSVTYTISSKVQPIYTYAEEGEKTFNKVVADAKYYTTNPSSQDKAYHVLSGTPYVSEDAGSLYYRMSRGRSVSDFVESFVNSTRRYSIIFYDTERNSYSVKKVTSLKVKEDKDSQNEINRYYESHYGGYKGIPAPVFSYTPKVEIITYSDNSVEWVYSEEWKLENEDELKAYIKSSPKKED